MTDTPGPLVASGRAADVYDVGDGRVLRRYREISPDIDTEVRVMRHVADRGYPVPHVHSFDGTDVVMDRIDGPTMLQALEAAPWKIVWHARKLAGLQRELARMAAPDWLLADDGAARAQSILHLDLHPMNVILSSDGPVVIDWTNASGGPAGFDGALTYVEISTFSVSGPRDRVGRWVFARAFRRFRGKRLIEPFVVAACDHRLADQGILPDERIAVAHLRRRASA